MLSARRLRQHATLFGALLGVVALVSGLSVGVIGYLSQAADEGVRAGLATRSGGALALRASLQIDEDPELQDRDVRAAIARTFFIDGRSIPIAVDRMVTAKADIAKIVDGAPGVVKRAYVISLDGIEDRATLVAGAWTTTGDEVTMQADAAERLDLVAGDRILLGEGEFTLTGTWRIDDHLDPRWLGETIFTDGHKDPDSGPVVIDESAWASLDTDPRGRWTIVPDVTQLTANDLAPIVDAWNGINSVWRGEFSVASLEKQGRFRLTALELGARVDALRAVEPVALMLLAAIALVTLAELGRLLTTTRANEIALLWSRGASATDVARTTAVEAAMASALGAAAGTGAAIALLAWVGGGLDAALTTGAALWILPLAVVAAAVAVVAGRAFRSARRQTIRDPSDASGRARRLAGPGALILVTAAAALSVWQLRLYGSPVVPASDGGTQVDPVAVVAPALALVAIVLIGLALFPRVAALDERSTRRAGVARILATRTVSRRLQLVAAPIVVVAVACANLVLAAGYATTWSDSFTQTSELRAGAPVHVTAGPPGFSSVLIDDVVVLPGVTSAAPLHVESLTLGNEIGSVLAVAPAVLAQVATTASGSFDREALADAIAMDIPGPVVPMGTSGIRMTAALDGFAETPTITLRIADALGVMRVLDLGAIPGEGSNDSDVGEDAGLTVFEGDVPEEWVDATGPWRIMAFDVIASDDAVTGENLATFEMRELEALAGDASTVLERDRYWIPEAPLLAFSLPNSNFNGQGFGVAADTTWVRMTPSFDDNISDRIEPPIVISQQLADRFAVAVGGRVSFSLEDTYINGKVVEIVPAIPGAEYETAVLLDLGMVQHSQLRLSEAPRLPRDLWIDTDDPAGVSAAMRPGLPANARIVTADDPAGRTVLGSAAIALWVGAAGCGLLAAVTVGAVVGAQLRSRRLDIVVLRALGLDARMQSAIRRRELLIVLAYGAIVGIVAGVAVTMLTVPQLARAAVPSPYSTVPTPLGADTIGLAAGLGALALVLAVIVAVYSIRVSRLARSSATPEDAP